MRRYPFLGDTGAICCAPNSNESSGSRMRDDDRMESTLTAPRALIYLSGARVITVGRFDAIPMRVVFVAVFRDGLRQGS